MSCTSLSQIAEQCGLNPAGLKGKLYVALAEDIAAIPTDSSLVVTTDITMQAAKYFVPWEFATDTGELKVYIAGTNSSKSYTATVDFNVSRHTAAIDLAIHNAVAAGSKIVAIILDNNGNMRILGGLEKGCDLVYKGTSGKKSGDVSGKDCVLKIEGLLEPPYYYTGALPIA